MAAPYIIPFNHQPVANATQTGTYTVSTGKYARVSIGSAKLPVLNSNNLYFTASIPSPNLTTSTTAKTFAVPMNCSRITIGFSSASGIAYYNFGTTTVTNTEYMGTFASTTSYSFPIGNYAGGSLISIYTSNTVVINSISCIIEPDSKEIWMKASDSLSFSAGSITYEEYNVIS